MIIIIPFSNIKTTIKTFRIRQYLIIYLLSESPLKENIQIELKDGYLKITATRNINKEDTRVLRQERFTGTYSRSFYIGEGYKQEDIKAHFDNGELFILLPTKPVKHEEETRYINIQ